MHHTKKAGPKFMPVKYFKTNVPLQTHVTNNGTYIIIHSGVASEDKVEALKRRYISHAPMAMHDYNGIHKCHVIYNLGDYTATSSLEEEIRKMAPYSLKILESVEYQREPAHQATMFMREVPKMSIEQSHALSRRMFARTAEERAEELYDDAE
ncbi:hypothetical protein LM902_002272 [Klebsiella oxytoca]|nr:hypothetical protein [Klebsiella oxytoca]